MGKCLNKRKFVFGTGVLLVFLAAIFLLYTNLLGINQLPEKLLAKPILRNVTKILSEKFFALNAEEPLYFFPNYPQRLIYVASEISEDSEELTALNEDLLEYIKECGCELAESQCKQELAEGKQTACKPGPIEVFGSPCPEQMRIEKEQTIQSDINDLTMELSFLQELLKKEMESAILEKQLQSLREEDAKVLRDNLEKLRELIPRIADPSKKNLNLPYECLVGKCSPNCQQGTSFTLEACLRTGIGQQKPTEVKFGVGVALEDLDLGKIGIKNINLSLPDEIQMPKLSALPSLSIYIPKITLTCPTERQTITFDTPSPVLPDAPTLKLTCPQYPNYSSYQCSVSASEESTGYTEAEWYFQTFSWLSEKCQDLPSMKTLEPEQMQKCFDKDNVHQTIITECANICKIGILVNIPPICKSMGGGLLCTDRVEAIDKECKNLFRQEGESIPANCNLETLQQKCIQLTKAGRETAPEPCKFLPLFTGKFPAPESTEYSETPKRCPSQKIGDYSYPVPSCSLAFPSLPKITFPKIEIPDIRLPTISFPPFFYVKLPNFIFEDLVIPDLDLCNLDDCQFMFPDLSFKIPSLRIPEIEVPPVLVNIPGIPQIEVKVAPIRFSPLAFDFSQLFNLSSLVTPELEMPNISLPQPKLQMSFKGLDIDFLNLLLGLFKIPSSVCISLDIKFVPIRIVFPDYIFSWPAFPKVPEIPFCEDTRQFCEKVNDSIGEITEKANQIQKQIDTVFQTEIQEKLDQIAQKVQQAIEGSLQEQLNAIAQKIEEALRIHLAKYAPESGVLPPTEAIPIPSIWPLGRIDLSCDKIPPLTIPLEDIVISSIPLADLINIPEKIPIHWPDSLKRIALSGDLGYELPTIPLSQLSYSKDITIRLPGVQRSSPSIDFNLLENATACVSQPPSGGNPCPTGQIQSNLEIIKGVRDEVKQTSQSIINILQ